MASHNIFQVRRIADRVGILLNGELIEVNTKEQILHNQRMPGLMHLSMGNSYINKSSQDMDIMERTHAKAKLWLVNNRDEPIMGEENHLSLKLLEKRFTE